MTRHLLLISGVVLIVLGGCSETVDPTLGTDEVFTLYGFFNPRADTQAVRLFPIEDRLEATEPLPIEAEVTTRNLESEKMRTWEDTVVLYPRTNTYGHVFQHAFRAEYGSRYQLTARRPDGRAARVTVQVPPYSEPMLGTPQYAVRQADLPVRWPDAPRLLQVKVLYRVHPYRDGSCIGLQQTISITHNDVVEQTDTGSRVTVPMVQDAQEVYERADLPRQLPTSLVLLDLTVRVFVVNEEWDPPGGTFDPEALVEPGTFSNVEEGFGFVGAGYPSSVTWLPPEEARSRSGFLVLKKDTSDTHPCDPQPEG